MEEEQSQINTNGEEVSSIGIDTSEVKTGPKHRLWIWIVIAALAVAGVLVWAKYAVENEAKSNINSYEECVAAGYPVMESYPEQCAVPGGGSFTRQLSEEEQMALDEQANQAQVKDCNAEENSQKNYSYVYPDEWSRVESCNVVDGSIVWSDEVKSLDHAVSTVGFGGTNKGAIVYISAESVSSLGAAYNSTQSILDGTAVSKSTFKEIRPIEVGSHKGVEYKTFYEGPGYLITQFEVNGVVYSFGLEEDVDGPGFNSRLDEYRQIVKSFKVIN